MPPVLPFIFQRHVKHTQLFGFRNLKQEEALEMKWGDAFQGLFQGHSAWITLAHLRDSKTNSVVHPQNVQMTCFANIAFPKIAN